MMKYSLPIIIGAGVIGVGLLGLTAFTRISSTDARSTHSELHAKINIEHQAYHRSTHTLREHLAFHRRANVQHRAYHRSLLLKSSDSTSSMERATCGNGVCEPREVPYPTMSPHLTYCPQDCTQGQGTEGAVCGNGVCESGEATECPPCTYANPPCMAPCRVGTCPNDCENGQEQRQQEQQQQQGGQQQPPPRPQLQGDSCDETKMKLDRTFEESRSCSVDSDCMVYEHSCPYITCGKPIAKNDQSKVSAAVEEYKAQCPVRMMCAMCAPATVTCEEGTCMLH